MQIKNETTNKNFGIIFSIFFLIISFYPLINHGEIREWSLILSIIFLVLGIINSKILNPLNNMWFKFGILLGKIISPLVMGVLYFFIVTPTSLIMKMLGKDILNLKKNNKKSYWIVKSNIISKMKNQF
jgi:cytochrome c oxidase subunit IV|tara:strand:- start:25 stop:408 length:384 start_codon:yes stop_codon:yes gene_type:complete